MLQCVVESEKELVEGWDIQGEVKVRKGFQSMKAIRMGRKGDEKGREMKKGFVEYFQRFER